MDIFRRKAWVNLFGKMSIFRLFLLLYFTAQKGVFSFQNKIMYIFLAYIAKKKKVGKMAIFGPKPWIIPFGKMSIFQFFGLPFFIAQKSVFSFWNIIKDILLAYIPQQKSLEKWPFLNQNHALTPLEKCRCLDFLNFLFLQPRKAFFSFQNII